MDQGEAFQGADGSVVTLGWVAKRSWQQATSLPEQARDSIASNEVGKMESKARLIVSRLVPLHETRERDFDIQFWQAQGPAAIIAAAQDMVESYLRSKGRADELRLQRTAVSLRKIRG